ncbi:MAG: LTA synthase family protein [Bacteroidales bacterium]
MKNYNYFVKSISWLVGFIAFGILLFFLSRIAYLLTYANFAELSNFKVDVLRAFGIGIRFDIKVLTIGLLPLVLLSFLTLLFGNKGFKIIRKTFHIYGFIILSIFALLMIIDYYFFSFYNSRISVIFFGFFEDDTLAVLKTIWTDFPLIPILIGLFVALFLLYKASGWVSKDQEFPKLLSNRVLIQAFAILVFVGVYFAGMRGTLAIIPLDGRHATFSENTFVNTLANNGVFALKIAYSDRKTYKVDINIPKMLKQYKFKTESEAISTYLGKPISSDTVSIASLISTTAKNDFLEQNPPSVVFVMMESMSNCYLNFHSDKTNLLGALENELKDCYMFRNFLSSYNGTIFSLESIMVNSPQGPLSQSKYQTVTLESSSAKPFVEKGYQTTFITGGKMGWRSMDKFINKQYFETIEAEPNLLKEYPDAKRCEWGVHDENMFDRTFEILSNAKKPQFIYAMTISHHSPYDIPESYQGYPLELTDEMKSKLKATPEIALKSLKAYQYANDCLGKFINKVRNSPLGKNTIIVATGDHNIHQIFDFTDKDLLMKYSVPFLLYVPDAYKPKNDVNTKKFGSHRDVFPTLFNLSLSDAKYVNSGNNLLSNDS